MANTINVLYLHTDNKKRRMSTLRTWGSTFTIQPGILINVLQLMKAKVISFDKTYISHRICYDKKFEKVYGPHRCGQTVIARTKQMN
ncbi:general transcription factor II-I repeat domain-containing protein 2-like [Aphis craccivora]|uniref:General transcription factor II-I repeat domain-containing protein 2-like n=1 Tax=Aphis craccivora TaxID=307492 RepID=A0A6G0YF42_APHCR|nr:general transcription factor II-I repeat domain-containing protein 2-like [Aphis craccivora]